MKKVFLFMVILFFVLLPSFSNCTNEENLTLVPHTVTKEELGGEISIPNEKGEMDKYSNIDTYEDLYSVLEDLSYNYQQLLEEYNSAQSNIEELNAKISELEYELENSDTTITSDSSDASSGLLALILIPVVLYGVPLSISYIIQKIKNKRNA